jgi:hypothetical protein
VRLGRRVVDDDDDDGPSLTSVNAILELAGGCFNEIAVSRRGHMDRRARAF